MAAGPAGVLAIMGRMRQEAEHAADRLGRSEDPWDNLMERRVDNSSFDPTPLRIAMEHLLSHQGQPLEKAAASFVIYSLGSCSTTWGHNTPRR